MGHAIFKQKSGVYGVGIVANCGVITPEQLIGLGRIAQETACEALKFTTRQTLLMLVPEVNLDKLCQEIQGMGLRVGSFGEVVRNVKACAAGEPFCLRGLTDVFSLAGRLQAIYMDQQVPSDFKISVAGCHRGCTDPQCADLGIVASGKDKFTLFLGGRGGGRQPVHATCWLEDISAEGVVKLVDHLLQCYRLHGEEKERLYKTIDRCGLEIFQPEEKLLESCRTREQEDDFLAFAGLT